MGGYVGLVGESGSGKSLTSLAIMRLVIPPVVVSCGQIMFKNQDVLKLSKREMRRLRGNSLSMVFQEPMSALDPVYTVGHQVAEALRVHTKISRKAAARRAVELLDAVGIAEPQRRSREYPHNLSGGMCQRVVIAIALANEPDLLIMDEPTTALDVTTQAQVLDTVQRLRANFNTAVLLISHDIGIIAESTNSVIVMYGGRIMEQGSVGQVVGAPSHPYTRGLIASSPTLGRTSHVLRSIPGEVPDPRRMPAGCPFEPRCTHRVARCEVKPELLPRPDGRECACWVY